MREPPKIADELIMAALHRHYDIAVSSLSFLPLGNDIASSAYRVEAVSGTVYFLKIRAQDGFSVPSLAVPRYLCDQGLSHIPAPLPTVTQALWVDVGGFALSLYPFIEGRMGVDGGLSAEQWRTLGALMRAIHSLELPKDLRQIIPRETFVPGRRAVIEELRVVMNSGSLATTVDREFAAIWHFREEEIRALVSRTDRLAEQLRRGSARLVLCHADMHQWNILIDTDQHLWLVDWDETTLALKERDLMFVVGGIGGYRAGPFEMSNFLQGYGDTTIDPIALAYYRHAWAVQDMAEYAYQVFFRSNVSDSARREALRGFASLFTPGNIVSLALASEVHGDLPSEQGRSQR